MERQLHLTQQETAIPSVNTSGEVGRNPTFSINSQATALGWRNAALPGEHAVPGAALPY